MGVQAPTGIVELVNKTVELPTIPAVITRLNEVTASQDASARDVAAVIAADPAVATNMLRIVNSPYYGLQVRVSSIDLAVSILGFNMTRKVALKAAVFSVFGKKKDDERGFDFKGFWRHAVFAAVAARTLGQASSALGRMHGGDLYMCGLLHDIGKIILLEKLHDRYLAMLAEARRTQRPDIDTELECFGFTHADVGSVLAIKWFLPEDLTIAIRYHHAPAKDPFHQSLSSLIHIADHLAWSAGKPSTPGGPLPALDVEAYDRVGLDPRRAEDLLAQIHEEFEATELPF
ncbi:MAG TPA: HDOD domain-containing protein [Planctomycetota bacterium]|nr:HDOD domain-containing protein [Planctomycetota bacterium]